MKTNRFRQNQNWVETMLVDRSVAVNEQWMHENFADCHDVTIQKLNLGTPPDTITILLAYNNVLCDSKQIGQLILPSLEEWLSKNKPIHDWYVPSLGKETHLDPLIPKVLDGELVLFFEGLDVACTIDIADHPRRNPEEANTEVSIRGPKDGFVEELSMNIGLVRKRLRTNSLSYEQFILGARSQTKVALLYMKDIIQQDVVNEARIRLSKIQTDAIYTSSQLEEALAESSYSLFPLFAYTGRPDYVVGALLAGRFVILVDGAPTAIVAPVNLPLLMKSPEDLNASFLYVSFERLLRIFGLLIALFLPGFYVAITTFHQDQIPLTLLATLAVARKGVPFPTPVDTFLMLIMFELFREAGMRLPSAIGQTLAVVGALIIGDAAIRTGLTSPSMLVVAGSTAVATFTLINQQLAGSVTILRLTVVFMSSILGIFGFLVSVFAILGYLANLRSFGVPYLAPASPLVWKDFVQSFLRAPMTKMRRRPKILNTKDSTRQGGK